jgi:hypothetical protein
MSDRQELIYRALRNVGALPQGQVPDAETYQSMSDLVDSLIAELEKRDIIYIENIDSFDDALLQPLGHLLAWRAAPEFGAANDVALASQAQLGEQYLNDMDRLDVHWNGKHWRTMRSDYPFTGCRITNYTTL